MTGSKLAPALRELIVSHLDSVEHLDLLLLLRSKANRDWSPEEASQELRSDAASARKKLIELSSKGLVDRVGSSRFAFPARNADLGILVDALGEAYRDHRYSVIQTIFSKPIRALSTFADAFRIKPGAPPDDTEDDDG